VEKTKASNGTDGDDSPLPAGNAPYNYHSLSWAETEALGAALGDESGIECWHFNEELPLAFAPLRLKRYFHNQFDRYCRDLLGYLFPPEKPWSEYSIEDMMLLDCMMGRRRSFEDFLIPYRKPWYEFHALEFLDLIEVNYLEENDKALWPAVRDVALGLKRRNFPDMAYEHGLLADLRAGDVRAAIAYEWVRVAADRADIVSTAAKLGRLVEQYYWRFKFDRVVEGNKTRASLGGRIRAASHREKHCIWQAAASEIAARRPDFSKAAIAETIKRQLCESCTAEHIARYITVIR
jgi:hypothetical protein